MPKPAGMLLQRALTWPHALLPIGATGSTTYVLDLADSAAVQRIMPHVRPLLQEPTRLLLMHGAVSMDLPLLQHHLGLVPPCVLDTQVCCWAGPAQRLPCLLPAAMPCSSGGLVWRVCSPDWQCRDCSLDLAALILQP